MEISCRPADIVSEEMAWEEAVGIRVRNFVYRAELGKGVLRT
jgi:hypothetical protein